MYNLKYIHQKQEKRYRVLRAIYELSDGVKTRMQTAHLEEIVLLPDYEINDILEYLDDEGLVTLPDDQNATVMITHRGIIEIEQSITSPNKATDHFMVPVIQNFYSQVGSVQNAPHSTSQVTQSIGASSEEVLALIEELRKSFKGLPSDKRREAIELADGLESEVKDSHPSKARMKAYLEALGAFASNTGANILGAIAAKSLGF
jgi:hypothetical protein